MTDKEYCKELGMHVEFVANGRQNNKEFAEKLKKMVATLPEKERLVLETRFPKDQYDFRDEEETANLLDMSVDEVKELEINAYRRLRDPNNNLLEE